ncbi:MAG: hypothetical protein VYB93_01230 [Pseudomonadota bacterium]|nr:hypothetical protein [Pseudomonadota bacterium]
MFPLKTTAKPSGSTPFSDFIRNAKSADKKRVYAQVLKKATERQNAVVSEVAQ